MSDEATRLAGTKVTAMRSRQGTSCGNDCRLFRVRSAQATRCCREEERTVNFKQWTSLHLPREYLTYVSTNGLGR
jgi:hypothetical protein